MTEQSVLRIKDLDTKHLSEFLEPFHLNLHILHKDEPIKGSFWGDSEAGLIQNTLYVREDTPVHSFLHESCHYICMDNSRRLKLNTNAGGNYDEENAVCYLQIVLADSLKGMTSKRMMKDMDAWGYTFRLGSTKAWFEQDAEDAEAWLTEHLLLDSDKQPTFQLRR